MGLYDNLGDKLFYTRGILHYHVSSRSGEECCELLYSVYFFYLFTLVKVCRYLNEMPQLPVFSYFMTLV